MQANGTEEHHSFWADSPVQESRLFDQFLDIVVAHEDSWIYTYGGYEAEFLRRMGRTPGRQAIVESMLARTCNILSIVYSYIYFPLYSNGLKEIARFLGFNWTEPDASGLQSLIWRSLWEDTLSPELKETLTIYNLEDCAALRKVTEFLYGIFSTRPREEEGQPTIHEGHTVSRIEEMATVSSRREWCKAEFVVPDFAFINKRAYFDYQRERIYVRSCKSTSRTRRKRSGMKLRRKRRVDQTIEITCSSCPSCGSTALTKKADGRLTHLTFDLSIRGGGIRRRLTRFKTVRYRCEHCGMWFLPREYMRLDDYSHSMKSWAMYLHVKHRNSFKGIAEIFKETFGVPISGQAIYEFKVLLAKYYAETYEKLLRMIVAGSVIYVDETEVHLRHRGKVYVWVFTNLQEVVFIYRESREASFLPDLLRDFRGVLVSDFYPGYDSLDCPQQKCLIHLIRDFNDDLRGNPWDEELKGLAARFGELLRSVVTTIDRYGLKKRHLGKHKGDVERFFKEVERADYRSEIAERYCTRFLKNRDKLFVFIEHDDVSWNNNNAEHAIKRFAHYREIADGVLTEAGLKEYLVLLSICVTCEYKGISFLKFLLSKKRDLDTYCKSPGPDRLPRAAELLPEGFTLSRRIRRHARDQNLNS